VHPAALALGGHALLAVPVLAALGALPEVVFALAEPVSARAARLCPRSTGCHEVSLSVWASYTSAGLASFESCVIKTLTIVIVYDIISLTKKIGIWRKK
jgi:hypothetical protein